MTRLDALHSRLAPEVSAVIRSAVRLADPKGQRLAVVGGVVRDLLLDRPFWDADVMTEAPAEPLVRAVAAEFGASVVSHPRFFTFALKLPTGRKVDVVTAREETYEKPAALPTVRPSTIEADLRRRDFTVNAIALTLGGPSAGHLLDPFGGQRDLERRVVRALHEKSFEDDPTRIFRAARFAGRLGFDLDPSTAGWIAAALKGGFAGLLSAVRRRHEFELILKEADPRPALRLLSDWRALDALYPGWQAVNPAAVRFPAPADGASATLIARLVAWLSAQTGDPKTALTSLAFEKSVKTKVLAALGAPGERPPSGRA